MPRQKIEARGHRRNRVRNRGGIDRSARAGCKTMMHILLALALLAAPDLKPVYAQIGQQHPQNIERLRQWIALPSIAAEGMNSEQGVQRMIELLASAGFQHAERVATDGKPGVWAIIDCAGLRPVLS